MTYTLENDHNTRYRALVSDTLTPIGREIVGYGYVAIDDTGEVYWGGSFPESVHDCAELSRRLRTIAKDCDTYAKTRKAVSP